MPRIDIPEYQSISATPQAPRADMRMHDAEFAAGRNLAGAVADAANTAAEIRQKAVDADEQVQLQNNLAALDEWQKDFAQEHANDDPKTWEAEFQKQSADKIAELTPKNLSSRGARSHKQATGLWTIRATGEIRHAATAKIVSNGFANGMALYNTRIAQLDPQGAADAVDLMRRKGLISENEAELKKAAIAPAIQMHRASDSINNDAYGALQQFNDDRNFAGDGQYSSLTPEQRKSFVTAARYAYNQQRVFTARQVADGIEQGEYPTQAQLDEWDRKKLFTRQQLDNLTREAAQKAMLTPENQRKLYDGYVANFAHASPLSDEDKAAFYQNLSMIHDPGLHSLALKRANDFFNPKSVMGSDTGKRVTAILDGMKTGGLFGEYYDLVPAKDVHGDETDKFYKRINPDKAAVMADNYMKAYDSAKSFMEKNPNAPLGDVLRHLTDATRTPKAEGLMAAFSKTPAILQKPAEKRKFQFVIPGESSPAY